MKGRFENVYLCHSGIVLKGLKIVKNSIFDNVQSSSFYLYAIFKLITEKKKWFAKGNYLIIHNHWSSGYHHWLTESLVRLTKVTSSEFTLIIPEDYPSFSKQSLELFDFENIIYLKPKTGVFVATLTVPENPISGYYKKSDLLTVKDVIFTKWSLSHSILDKKIYVSRENANLRLIENEEEVIEYLTSAGFLVVRAESLSFKEQVTLFSSCKLFVSIHGAALTNCLFMAKNTNLLELYRQPLNENDSMNNCYERMTHALGINHQYLLCETGENLGKHIDKTNLKVDLKMFKKTIETYI